MSVVSYSNKDANGPPSENKSDSDQTSNVDLDLPAGYEGTLVLVRGLRASSPHLVLIAVYLAYLGIGGLVFLGIEGGNEAGFSRDVARYNTLKTRLDEALLNITEGRDVTVRNLTALWENYTALVDEPYLTNLAYYSRVNWTFTASVLFCATSIATIGYGDVVPLTGWGRIVIVIYSLIGIPLTLTFLADIGALLARSVVYISQRYSCFSTTRRSDQKRRESWARNNGNGGDHDNQNGLAHRPGHGMVAGLEPPETRESLVDMRLSLGVFTNAAESVRGSQPNSRRSSVDAEWQTQTAEDRHRAGTAMSTVVNERLPGQTNLGYAPDDGKCFQVLAMSSSISPDEGQPMEDHDTMQRHVPVLLVAAILFVYTFLGALMIAYVEEWYYGEALYFTFITLTTIGFGDFVPVKHYLDLPSFVGCLVYTIVGLSVMSMCIALVQAKAIGLVSRVAGKIGF